MKERTLLFNTEAERKRFMEALRKAASGAVEPDDGWTKPALRVRVEGLAQILAASMWAGFEPIILE